MENVKLNPRDVFGEILLELGEKDKNIMAVSCDSGAGSGMSAFKEHLPQQFLEVGISEQNAIGVCAGLADSGRTPIVSAIAPFISMRCFEQIRNDVGYANKNVKIIASSTGLAHSNLGSTHQAIEDMALLRTVPNMVIFNPGDGYEVEMCLRKAAACKGPFYIRMPRHSVEMPLPPEQRNFEVGKAETLLDTGKDITILVTGTLNREALEAGKVLSEKGYGVRVINFTTVQPLDKKTIRALYRSSKIMCTVEEHITTGGFGSSVLESVADIKENTPVYLIGIAAGAIQTGPYNELLKYHGLTSDKLAETIESYMKI
ncbi:MAG: transketolase C-terminal domain-containing protein [Eubacterium sp.]|nr:transketolase C-terminal domain-containing protein [Eubacterium sp.]